MPTVILAIACAVFTLLGVTASTAAAQARAPSGIVQSEIILDSPPLASEARRPSARPYVLTGALIGVTGMVVGLIIHAKQTNSELMVPFALAPAVLGAGVVGGVAGYVVYRIRNPKRSTSAAP